MSVFSKIVVVILVVLTCLYVKDKYFKDYNLDFFNKTKPEIQQPKHEEPTLTEEKVQEKVPHKKEESTYVYFLATSKDGTAVFRKVKRNLSSKDRLDFAIRELLKGPNAKERSEGIYNEIPKGTKLLNIQKQGNNIIINLSSDFQYGGGTDSIYSRMRQLIKTALANTSGKNIYLYLDGKQADVVGGEGIMVSQPLSENSLDD